MLKTPVRVRTNAPLVCYSLTPLLTPPSTSREGLSYFSLSRQLLSG